MTEDGCFTPYDPESATKYEESVFYQPEDSLTMDDLFGFRGPCVAYLARELVSPEDMEVCLQIGHTSPFSLWINGELIARRDNCDTFDNENVHIRGIKLKKGVNRILWRLTRANSDAKYSLIFAEDVRCARNHVCFGAVRPEFFGK